MRIDLHCHTKHSKRPTLWLMQKLGCPESFTEPAVLYDLLLQKGMGAVTITDHNVIDGCLEIAHLPNTFISCEYTTYFPEDRCKVHVLAYDISEQQHRDLSEARENILDMADYLNQRGIHHVCAHPFFGPNDRLTPAHIEKLALLFKNWELNGDQNPVMNDCVKRLLDGLNPVIIYRLADKHGIAPELPELWKKNVTAGSDDHSSLNLGSAYTEVVDAETLGDFWDGVENGRARIHIRDATPEGFARNIYGIAYQFYKSKFGLDWYIDKDVLLQFLDRILQARAGNSDSKVGRMYRTFASRRRTRSQRAGNHSLIMVARDEAEKLLQENAELMEIVNKGLSQESGPDTKWFEFTEKLSNQLFVHVGTRLVERLAEARLFDLFDSLGSAGALATVLGAHFVSYSHFAGERRFSEHVLAAFAEQFPHLAGPAREARVAHFTDTFDEVNGVARTLHQQLASARRLGKPYTIVTCSPSGREAPEGVCAFGAVGAYELPEYPELKLLAPPFLRMLRHCYERGYTHIHLSTPGPVGLAGLAIARVLRLPVSGTYHTAVPEYGRILTEDSYVEDLLWKGMIWFYDQLDTVYVPSHATGEDLLARGISPAKIRVYPRGVDTSRFHPSNGSAELAERWGLEKNRIKILYAGRVSREKNLALLVHAIKALTDQGLSVQLAVAGDGPFRTEMEASLQGLPAVFTGYLEGAELPALYASCDLFAFPSATDTFGNVVLEAQASGLPVVVVDKGGPRENLLPGTTGLVVPADDTEAFTRALAELSQDAPRRAQMGRAARKYMETRGFDQAFARLWDMYVGVGCTANPAPGLNQLFSGLSPIQALAG